MEILPSINSISKNTDSYQEWFISALKSSKVSQNGDREERNLLQNCSNCYNQVRKLLEKNGENWVMKYDEFRLNSVVIILLACPSVKSVARISYSKDLYALTKSLPTVKESDAIFVIQGLKNYIYLRGVLPWLPIVSLSKIISEFFSNVINVTPISLAISFEMLVGLFNSLLYERDNYSDELTQLLELFYKYFTSKESSVDVEQNERLDAYYFLYLFESLFLCLKLIALDILVDDTPMTSLALILRNLYADTEKKFPEDYDSIIKDFAAKLTTICSRLIPYITADVWIAWHSIRLPLLDLPQSLTSEKRDKDTSPTNVQLQVAHTAFKVNKLVNHSIEIGDILQVKEYPELGSFLIAVSLDPNHDPDTDCPTAELVLKIEEDTSKRQKLANIFIMRDDIFESLEYVECAKNYGNLLKADTVVAVLEKFIGISHLHSNTPPIDGWKEVILDIAKNAPVKALINVIRRNLDDGMDDCLRTKDFLCNATYVFNQLADSADNSEKDLFVWLCLQDGKEVIRQLVNLVLSLSGLVPVASSALSTTYFICRKKSGQDYSILTSCLLENLDESMTVKKEKEFRLLISELLGKPNLDGNEDEQLNALPLNIYEIIDFLVIPHLIDEGRGIHKYAALATEILKMIVNAYPDCVLENGPKLASLIISMTLLYNNCCMLVPGSFSSTLELRKSLQYIIVTLIERILHGKEDYGKVVAYLKQYFSTPSVHSRCLLLLAPLLELSIPGDLTLTDKVFYRIICSSLGPLYAKLLSDNTEIDSRTEFIWSLAVHLPHCSYSEWTQALKMTYNYFHNSVGQTYMLTSVIKLFQEVLCLICATSYSAENKSGVYEESAVSVEHCFKAFSVTASKFIKEELSSETPEKQFHILNSIFVWWCRACQGFKCNHLLPCLMLNSICSSIEDLFTSESLRITGDTSSVKEYHSNVLEHSAGQSHEMQLANSEAEGYAVQQKEEDGVADRLVSPDSNVNCQFMKKSSSDDNSIKTGFITNSMFTKEMDNLIMTFILNVKPNEIASTIAGKLKAIIERIEL